MEIKLALKVNDKDNVATIFANGITPIHRQSFLKNLQGKKKG